VGVAEDEGERLAQADVQGIARRMRMMVERIEIDDALEEEDLIPLPEALRKSQEADHGHRQETDEGGHRPTANGETRNRCRVHDGGLALYPCGPIMAPGFFAALSLVRRTSAEMPPAARAHVIGRFLTCPFLRVLAHVPPGARVLDLGAGHGTWARLAVEHGAAASVVAVEPDLRKTLPGRRHPRIRCVAGYADAV